MLEIIGIYIENKCTSGLRFYLIFFQLFHLGIFVYKIYIMYTWKFMTSGFFSLSQHFALTHLHTQGHSRGKCITLYTLLKFKIPVKCIEIFHFINHSINIAVKIELNICIPFKPSWLYPFQLPFPKFTKSFY